MSQKRKETQRGMFEAGGRFFVGCNYWASHAGIAMWRKWDADTVRADLKLLSENAVEVLRVFPLWPDFQPISRHTAGGQSFVEMRFGEQPLPDTPAGRAGVDPVMVERFRTLCAYAAEYRLRLIVGLVTGWMSGRMFVPPAFSGVNVLTDPTALKWEVRMVRHLVSELRNETAIAAWDLGNECNCMGPVEGNPDAAWAWTNAISAAIRVEDASRPVVSGMHSLTAFKENGLWNIGEQAELTDVLTTHPYPLFTPHCNLDPIHTMRNAFHATAETRLYGDVGRVDAFIEEAGTLGPSQSGDSNAANLMRAMLWNGFAHDCRGMLWWCAFDQDQLEETPYDWMAIERELGLVRSNREPKPALIALREFSRALDRLNLRTIPPFRRDAVVILSREQDNWGVGYSSFLLAKQAGFDVEFATADQELPESKFYILPSVRGLRVIDRRRWLALLDKVEKGATLLVTSDGGTLQPFNAPFGVDIVWTAAPTEPVAVIGAGMELYCPVERLLKLSARDAEVLASDCDGTPVMTSRAYGKGKLLFLSVPIERHAANQPRAFLPGSESYYKIYQLAAAAAGVERSVTRTNPSLTLTEHRLARCELLVIAVNNTPDPITDAITAGAGWAFDRVLCGGRMEWGALTVPGNSAAVMVFRCNN